MYGGEDAAPVYILEEMMRMVKKIMMTPCNGSSNSTSEIMPSKRQIRLTFPNYSSFCWWSTTKQTYWGYGILIAHSSTAVSLTHIYIYLYIHLDHFVIVLLLTTEMQMRSWAWYFIPLVSPFRRMGLVSTSSKGQDENGKETTPKVKGIDAITWKLCVFWGFYENSRIFKSSPSSWICWLTYVWLWLKCFLFFLAPRMSFDGMNVLGNWDQQDSIIC